MEIDWGFDRVPQVSSMDMMLIQERIAGHYRPPYIGDSIVQPKNDSDK